MYLRDLVFPSLQEIYTRVKMIHVCVLIKPTMLKMKIWFYLNMLIKTPSPNPIMECGELQHAKV